MNTRLMSSKYSNIKVCARAWLEGSSDELAENISKTVFTDA